MTPLVATLRVPRREAGAEVTTGAAWWRDGEGELCRRRSRFFGILAC
jgi:hypothetical protein